MQIRVLIGETQSRLPCTLFDPLVAHHEAELTSGHSETRLRSHQLLVATAIDSVNELRVQRVRAIAAYFFAGEGERIFTKTSFLDLMSFAEAYHRVMHVPRPPARERLRDRVDALFARVAPLVAGMKAPDSALRKQLVKTRHYFTHWTDETDDVLDGAGLWDGARYLKLVLQANILLDLGIDPTLAKRLPTESYAGRRM